MGCETALRADRPATADNTAKDNPLCLSAKSFQGNASILPNYANLSILTLPIRVIIDGTTF
jgi:hypothetical protein